MPIYWTPKLATGVARIDEEHKELFDRINKLVDALSAGKGKESVAPLIGFLKDYVSTHFGGEQAMMRQHRYGGAAEHMMQHQHFSNEFEKLVATYEKAGPSGLLVIQLNKLLCDWLREHIATKDKAFGDFLQAQGIVAQA